MDDFDELGDPEVKEVKPPDPWFAVKIALGALAIHFTLGTFASIMFFAGWFWGVRNWSEG